LISLFIIRLTPASLTAFPRWRQQGRSRQIAGTGNSAGIEKMSA